MTISIYAPYAKERFETARQRAILHPERIVGNHYLGIISGSPVIQRESIGTSQLESPVCLLSMWAADYFD
jgi:hypothetical protein